MKLLFLHGAPAVGKLTVAKALLEMVPARLMDNHASIDLAKTVFDFSAPGFWEVVDELRKTMLAAAARSDLDLLITTACYGHPEDLPIFAEWEAVLQRNGASMVPVHLFCSHAEMMRRIGQPDRVARGKLTTAKGLQEHLDRNDYAPVPRASCFSLDTSAVSATETARVIANRLALTKGSKEEAET